MGTVRFTRPGVTLALLGLSACHVSAVTELPQLEFARLPEPRTSPIPPPDAPHELRPVPIYGVHAERHVVLTRASLRVVPGSQCRLHHHPVCGPRGDCLASVHVYGDVCVLVVRATSHTGDALDPYCHDLSRPAIGAESTHPVWERCASDLPGAVEPWGRELSSGV